MQKTKGFTLVEMLVVVAIVGILAGMVVVGMSGSEDSAKDSRLKSDLDQIRTRAIILEKQNGNYGEVACSGGDAGVGTVCDDVQIYNSGFDVRVGAVGGTANSGYCAYVPLYEGGYGCIDYTGDYNFNMSSAPDNCLAANCGGAANVCECN